MNRTFLSTPSPDICMRTHPQAVSATEHSVRECRVPISICMRGAHIRRHNGINDNNAPEITIAFSRCRNDIWQFHFSLAVLYRSRCLSVVSCHWRRSTLASRAMRYILFLLGRVYRLQHCLRFDSLTEYIGPVNSERRTARNKENVRFEHSLGWCMVPQ